MVEHWRRLASKQGAAKDAEAERIDDEHVHLARLAEAARVLQRLRPGVVVSWTSDPPFWVFNPATRVQAPEIRKARNACPGHVWRARGRLSMRLPSTS